MAEVTVKYLFLSASFIVKKGIRRRLNLFQEKLESCVNRIVYICQNLKMIFNHEGHNYR